MRANGRSIRSAGGVAALCLVALLSGAASAQTVTFSFVGEGFG